MSANWHDNSDCSAFISMQTSLIWVLQSSDETTGTEIGVWSSIEALLKKLCWRASKSIERRFLASQELAEHCCTSQSGVLEQAPSSSFKQIFISHLKFIFSVDSWYLSPDKMANCLYKHLILKNKLEMNTSFWFRTWHWVEIYS